MNIIGSLGDSALLINILPLSRNVKIEDKGEYAIIHTLDINDLRKFNFIIRISGSYTKFCIIALVVIFLITIAIPMILSVILIEANVSIEILKFKLLEIYSKKEGALCMKLTHY